MIDPHEELKAQYALDELENPDAWLLWEVSANGVYWLNLMEPPSWTEYLFYRRKQPREKMITNHKEFFEALLAGETVLNGEYGDSWRLVNGMIEIKGSVTDLPYSFAPLKLKPKTIQINGFDVPCPLREAPSDNTVIFLASVNNTKGNNYAKWVNDLVNFEWLRNGIVHLTEEAAELHREALLSFTKLNNV